MTTYYVATIGSYVLVEAASEEEARALALPLLHGLREKVGGDVPINICTVRPATDAEVELQRFHDEMVAREREFQVQ